MTIDTSNAIAVPSHFDRIGGAAVVRLAVEKFCTRVAGDGEIAHYFASVEPARLKRRQAALLTDLLGGPCGYEGRDLAEAHKDVRVMGADFDRVAGHLVATLHELSTPLDIVDSLTAAVASVRSQIAVSAGGSKRYLLASFGFRR